MGWIINGFIQTITTAISDALSLLTTKFLLAFDLQFSKFDEEGNAVGIFDQFFPAAGNEIQPMILALGYGLFFVILFFQLAKGFLGPLSDGEHPISLVGRSSLGFVLMVFCYDIITVIQEPLNDIYKQFAIVQVEGQPAEMPETLGGEVVRIFKEGFQWPSQGGWEAVLMEDTVGLTMSTVGFSLITFIFVLAIGWAYIRLLLEIVERYIILGVMFYTAPLAFSMIGSASTRPVFQSWVKMMASQYILMFLNIFFLKVFLSAMYNMPDPVGGGVEFSQYFLWNLCLLAFLKLGQQIDRHMASLGLSTAQAGATLGGAIAATVLGMGGAVTAASKLGSGLLKGGANLKNMTGGGAAGSVQSAGSVAMGAGILEGFQGYEKATNLAGISQVKAGHVDTKNSFYKPGEAQIAYNDGSRFNIRPTDSCSPDPNYSFASFTGTDGKSYYMAGHGDLGTLSDVYGGNDLKSYLDTMSQEQPGFHYEAITEYDPNSGEDLHTGAYNVYTPDGDMLQYSPRALYDVPESSNVSMETFGDGHFEWNRIALQERADGIIGERKPLMDESFSQFSPAPTSYSVDNQGAKFYNSIKR